MAAYITKSVHWISLLWDKRGKLPGFAGYLWATRKLILILAGTIFLTWRESVEHHPPEIVIVALLHFVFVFGAVAAVVLAVQWSRRPSKLQPKP